MNQSPLLNTAVIAMIGAMLLPIYHAWKEQDIWETMLAFSSVAAKSAVMMLLIAIMREDWMIGVVGVIILSVGNAGLMIIAHIIKRTGDV
ncbi:MAG: hypothetical protein NW214_06945 [Pseudanabaenaceae cyanobacterium bins.39]|nr:hypothetical protein [Pseudanabaenaceae cyanobacterium bins.39]